MSLIATLLLGVVEPLTVALGAEVVADGTNNLGAVGGSQIVLWMVVATTWYCHAATDGLMPIMAYDAPPLSAEGGVGDGCRVPRQSGRQWRQFQGSPPARDG